MLRVLSWLMDSYPPGTNYLNAGLIIEVGQRGAGAQRKATRLGEDPLAQGKVAEYLKG